MSSVLQVHSLYWYTVVSILNRMFRIGMSTTNENTFIHCVTKLITTDHARYLRYGRRYRAITDRNCFSIYYFLLQR